jgi:hypothetical protein
MLLSGFVIYRSRSQNVDRWYPGTQATPFDISRGTFSGRSNAGDAGPFARMLAVRDKPERVHQIAHDQADVPRRDKPA